jgi:hypothetical protein
MGVGEPGRWRCEALDRIARLLCQLYGKHEGTLAFERVRLLMASSAKRLPPSTTERLPDEKEIVLITYADTLRQPQQLPLPTFYTFAQRYLKQTVSTIHFLPFFPFSSDDGFSVIDYIQIDPARGIMGRYP